MKSTINSTYMTAWTTDIKIDVLENMLVHLKNEKIKIEADIKMIEKELITRKE